MASRKRKSELPVAQLQSNPSGTTAFSFDVSGGTDDSVEPSAESGSIVAPFSGTTGPSTMSQATIGPALPSSFTTGSIGPAIPSFLVTSQSTESEDSDSQKAQEWLKDIERATSGSEGSLSSGVSYTSNPTSISTTTSTMIPSSTSMTTSTTTSTSTTAKQGSSYSAAEDYERRAEKAKSWKRPWESGAYRQTYMKVEGLNIGVFEKTKPTYVELEWMKTVAAFWAAGVTSEDGTPIKSTHALLL